MDSIINVNFFSEDLIMRRSVCFAIVCLSVLGLVAQAEVIRTTAFKQGADTFIGNDGNKHHDQNFGGGGTMDIRNYPPNTRAHMGYIRFDISGAVGNMSGTLLQFYITQGGASRTWNVYGLIDNAVDDAWGEMTVTYDTAPGFLPTDPVDNGTYVIDTTKMTLLGTLAVTSATGLFTSNPATLDLAPFLNADTNGLVTLALVATGSDRQYYVAAKEGLVANPTWSAPTLIMPNASLGGAINPQPADGAIVDRFALTQLSWSLLPEVAKMDIYFGTSTGTEPNILEMDKLSFDPAVTSVNISDFPRFPTPLADGTYYWRIDCWDGAPVEPNFLQGGFWSFTAPSAPVVPTNQPVNVRVFPAEPAVLTVDFSSFYPPTVKWFKNDNTTVTEVTAGIVTINNGGGSFTTTLTLSAPVSSSAEGQYYCEVTNDGGTTWQRSGSADLVAKRQLAQYAFNGDLADSSGNSAPSGTALDTQGEPNSLLAVAATIHYVAGVDGVAESALYLDLNEYVDFGVEGYPKATASTSNGFGAGLDEGTIVFWVKPTADALQTVMGAFNDGSTSAFQTLLQADQDLDLFVRGTSGTTLANHVAARPNRPEYNLTDGNWHMMAACWSGNAATLYVDGQWVVNTTGSTPASYAAWQRGVLLGASRTSADRNILSDMFRGGAVDSLRIYNYRLDATVEAFAQEYLDNTGVHPCTNMSFVGNTYNYDNTGSSYCKIDLADFADFAAAWLADGLY